MRAFLVLSASLVAALAVYAVPLAVELLLIRVHANPWFVCVLLGDLAGCAFLYLLGFRMAALIVYVLAGLFEAVSLLRGMPPHTLVWMTNIAPALAGAIVTMRIALRWLVTRDRSV
jgi:hypothetical protein